MFNPLYIFSLLWFVQVVLHILFYDIFVAFDYVTWLIIFIAFVSFSCGSLIFSRIKPAQFALVRYGKLDQRFYIYFCRLTVLLYLFGAVVVSRNIYYLLIALTGGDLNPISIRQVLINDFTGDRALFSLVRYFFIGVMLSVFTLSFSKNLSNRSVRVVIIK